MNTKVLSRTYLFEGLNVKELELLLVAAAERICSKDDIVFREGEAGHKIFMVSQGTVEIWKKENVDLKGSCLAKVKDGELDVDKHSLENANYTVKLDKNGDIASIFDKRVGKELLEKPAQLEFLADVIFECAANDRALGQPQH